MSRRPLLFLLAQTFLLFDMFLSFTLNNCTMEFSETVTLSCQQRLLQKIPDDVPLNSEVLDVSFNQISQIKNDLKRFLELNVLLVTRNQLQHIDDEAFVNLKKLRILDLSHNNLTNLTQLVFAGLHTLTSLNLEHNHISQIAPKTFQPLFSLHRVVLSFNRISNLADITALFTLPNMQQISLTKNLLTSFDSDDLPFNSSNVTEISLNYNKLQNFSLKRDVFPRLSSVKLTGSQQFDWYVASDTFLRNVTEISLSENFSLASFSAILNSTRSLQTLLLTPLDKPTAKSFVQIACSTTSVKTLTLTFLTLRFIDHQFFQSCSQLQELKLPFNNIEQLSSQSFNSLTELKGLDMNLNQLSKVPVSVRPLWTLEVLDLSSNSIREINCLDFANLTRLISLNLRRNQIVHLEQCYFQNLFSLDTLDLGRNPVHTIGRTFEVGLSHLRVLLLSGNLDQFWLGPGAFRNLSSLRILNLKSNKFIFTEYDVFEGMEKLRRLVSWVSEMSKELFKGLRDLVFLELHMNSFGPNTRTDQNSSDETPFSNLQNLTQLLIFVEPTFSVKIFPDVFQGLQSLVSLKVDYFFRAPIHRRTFTHTPLLTRLSITNSDFSFLSAEVFDPIPKLEELDLSKNKLTTLEFLGNLRGLQMLVVHDNHLSIINETLFQSFPSLTYLDLSKNALLCDCLNAGFQEWVWSSNRTQVVGGASYQCMSPVTQLEQRFLDFDTRLCKIDIEFILFVSCSSVTLLTLVLSFVYHFLRWQLIYAYNLFLAHVYDTKRRRRNEAHRYDAFISYSVHDEEWVCHEMLPVLEGQQGWRLCLHHRDFQPGKPIVENITDAIYSSRKTVCVISTSYLQSDWCSREIQMASVRLFDEHKDVLVLVFLEELSPWRLSPYYRMRRLMKKRSYLRWPRASQHRAVFWQNLRRALESDAHPDQQHRLVQSEQE
ncbi:toll-like receptor 13 [Boleophthalmus pectinirostris]|uniref:toll-like receptor 13 n=1 Tax=Boleophthalmus pectinirostris TaxID=150288 RepID=UPI00242A4A1C|nr:toll-like receptor 13 [Boleophthalmus pectinirostris]XP_055012049.1 toll-like receptor 13 [Boleophthalmus pectinirostris]